MKLPNLKEINPFSQLQTIRIAISDFLNETYAENEGLLGNLDRWTRSRIVAENVAKLELVIASDDPVEACYRDLVREIDCEARTGVYLVTQSSVSRHLKLLLNEPGVSAMLHREVPNIAHREFADESAHSSGNFDLVWTTIQALHDRAHTDAAVSMMIMSYLLDDTDNARDVTDALRALFYPFHEDNVRRRCDLTPVLGDQDIQDIRIMVGELVKRSGGYQVRTNEIESEVERFYSRALTHHNAHQLPLR